MLGGRSVDPLGGSLPCWPGSLLSFSSHFCNTERKRKLQEPEEKTQANMLRLRSEKVSCARVCEYVRVVPHVVRYGFISKGSDMPLTLTINCSVAGAG